MPDRDPIPLGDETIEDIIKDHQSMMIMTKNLMHN